MVSTVLIVDSLKNSFKEFKVAILNQFLKVKYFHDWALRHITQIGIDDIDENKMVRQTQMAQLQNQCRSEVKKQMNACDIMRALLEDASVSGAASKLNIVRSDRFKEQIRVLRESRARQMTLMRQLVVLQTEDKKESERRETANMVNKTVTNNQTLPGKRHNKLGNKIAKILSTDVDNNKKLSENQPILDEDVEEEDEFEILRNQLKDMESVEADATVDEDEMQKLHSLLSGGKGTSFDGAVDCDEDEMSSIADIITRLNNRPSNASNVMGSSSSSNANTVGVPLGNRERNTENSNYGNVFGHGIDNTTNDGHYGNINNNKHNRNSSIISEEISVW